MGRTFASIIGDPWKSVQRPVAGECGDLTTLLRFKCDGSDAITFLVIRLYPSATKEIDGLVQGLTCVALPLLKQMPDMHAQRKTINANVSITGIGLHSGIYTKVELHPAPAGSGITFVRADLKGLRIPALQASTTALDYATTVGKDDVSVGTVEHLLSAIMACGVTDLDIFIDGPEVPIVDGSALPFMHLIDAAGVRDLGVKIPVARVRRALELVDGDKSIRITPANSLILNYGIDFKHPAIGRQSFRFDYNHDSFLTSVAPARTFGFVRDVERMRAAGLARGGSVENCIVLDDHGVISGALRFQDEFVRHKILDLLGDLALMGRPIVGEITASKAGHAMHSQFVAMLQRELEREEESDSPHDESRASAESFA